MHFPFDNFSGAPLLERAIFAVAAAEDRARFLDALREAGANNPCRFFAAGEELVEALFVVLKGATPPLLCFLDVNGSGMPGLDVLRWIRLQDALAEISVVMLSAADDPASVGESLRLGAQCHSKKFPSPIQLREILNEAAKFSAVASGRSAFNLRCNLLLAAQPTVS